MSLKQLLTERRDDILARFLRDVEQKELPPHKLSRSVLVDHIPMFLAEIVEELSKDGLRLSRDAVQLDSTAREHGEQRWKAGYDLEAVVREY
ncbi:MAG: RsbT co-antagonist protein rsbRD N-terminal domain, partial [Pseudomonadota bacterium]